MNEETKISSIVDVTISDIIFKSFENFLECIVANTFYSSIHLFMFYVQTLNSTKTKGVLNSHFFFEHTSKFKRPY